MSKKDFSKFGSNFQEKLAEIILRDRVFADRIFEVLQIDNFEKEYLRVFVEQIMDYREDYGVHPSISIMESVIRENLDEYDDALARKVREYFAGILSRGEEGDVEDEDYVKDTALDFCRCQNMRKAILEGYELTKEENYEAVVSTIKEAMKQGEDNCVGHEYIKDFESRYEGRKRETITTGWGEIDEVMQDGHGKGELGVCIAPTSGGKSMVLTHFGAHALQEGKNVVHYTLELSSEVIGSRYDSCITGIPLDNLDDHKDGIEKKIKDVDGDLIIKQYPTKSATPQTIQRHIEKIIRQGKNVDEVIVDYGDLLSPVQKGPTKRDDLQSIYESLRSIAQEYDVAVFTASQTNRQGLNKEVITMEQISEAYNKCFVSDFIFTLSQTIEDKDMGTGRIFVAKNRNGPDGQIFPVKIDFSQVHINVLPPDSRAVKNMREKREEQQKEDISEEFDKFRMNQ